MRILMAENHEVFASTVTREFLSGHDVLVVNTLQRALEALESHGPFDAILSDFDLDDGYGTELVRGLRDSEFSGLVLAMSAKDDANVALIDAGADVACSKMEFSGVRGLLDDLLTPVPMKRASVERMLASLDGLTVGDAFGERFFVPDELASEWIRRRQMPEPPWAYTDDSAQVTHAHIEGQAGAVAVAAAAAFACRHREGVASGKAGRLLDLGIRLCPPGATRDGLIAARDLHSNAGVAEAAATLGSGAKLLASDTVPFALWCADQHLNDFGAAMWSTVQGLGDRDTTCAIAGGVVAGNHRPPGAWLRGREPVRFESSVPTGSASGGRGLRDRAEAWMWSLRAGKRPKT
jgi:CheY-like chemotaxis protein